MAITTVLFDLDDTLCEHPKSTDDRLMRAFERSGIEPFFDATDMRRWIPEINADSALEFRRALFRAIARENERDTSVAATLADVYEIPEPTSVRFRPGAEQVLETLASSYQLGLVTNGGRATQQQKLDTLEITDAFDATVFSEPGRPVKPDTEPFERALTSLDAAPHQTVHVGNSIGSDVAGANAAGLRSVWIPELASIKGERKRSGITPDVTLETLSELPATVRQTLTE